jgi:putative membrane protein
MNFDRRGKIEYLSSVLYLKAFHVIAMVAWMAGMLYLPRLYVYHTEVTPGTPEDLRFQTMERRLLRAIMNPAMIGTILLGMAMIVEDPTYLQQGWLHAKLALVVIMLGVHGYLARCRKTFAAGRNAHPARFYRWLNEAPTVLLIVIVILAVVKPF